MSIKMKKSPKKEILQKHGTLNPRPEKVIDGAFNESDFFDPMDIVQVKYEMIRRVSQEGKSISEASSLFGFSRPSFYEARYSFEKMGIAGLCPMKRGPRSNHKLTDEVMGFVLNKMTKDEPLGVSAIIKLILEKFGLKIHRRSIERAIARQKKNTPIEK